MKPTLLFCVPASLLLVLPADAITISIPAVADATLFASPTGAVANGGGDYFFAGVNAEGNVRRGLIRFDLSGVIPAGATVTAARLTLFADRARLVPSPVTLHRVTASWSEGNANPGGPEGQGSASQPGAVTWIHRDLPGALWSSPGGDFIPAASSFSDIAVGPMTWSGAGLLADVLSWQIDPSTNFGWELLGVEFLSQTASRFISRSSPVTANRPALVIEYTPVPEPGVITILTTTGGLILLRRPARSRNFMEAPDAGQKQRG